MTAWTEVTTLEQLNDFLDTVGGFHDGIIKEIHWVNNDYVSPELRMRCYQFASARMLVQRQKERPSAVEIQFENIEGLHIDTVQLATASSARSESRTMPYATARNLLTLQIEQTEIVFEKLRWRDASDWMGPELRFTPQPPEIFQT